MHDTMTTRPPSQQRPASWPDRVVRVETTQDNHEHRITRLEVAVWLLGWLILNQKLALALMDLSEQLGDMLRG